MAYSLAEREKKKQQIVQKTGQLLKQGDYSEIKIIDIAEKINMAKGSVYNFFSSKEEIFLELYSQEVTKWVQEIREIFAQHDDIASCLNLLVERHCQRTLFLKLMSFLNAILEQKLPYEKALGFKLFLGNLVTQLTTEVGRTHPRVAEHLPRFLIHYNAHCIGLLQMSKKSLALKKIFSLHKELSLFNPNLESELKYFTHLYFKGLKVE